MAKLKTGRHTSALKAVRQARKRRWANAAVKDEAKRLAKAVWEAVSKKDAAKAREFLAKASSFWTRLGRRNVVHHAAASRKVGQLSKAVARLPSSPKK
jgi:small subunit ribosomal protein S20